MEVSRQSKNRMTPRLRQVVCHLVAIVALVTGTQSNRPSVSVDLNDG